MGTRKQLTFVDLFAGIGGFHLAFSNVGARCVWAAEWDEAARKTYEANFRAGEPSLFDKNRFAGDVTKVKPEDIPDFDILAAGFPCQPFSQAGLKRGFEEARGTLFFNIAEILSAKRPEAFFLENVRGLMTHDRGRTFATISHVLREELGYSLFPKVVRATDYGLPTHRPRLYMIGFRDPGIQFASPPAVPLKFNMSDVLGGHCDREIGYTLRVGGKSSGIDDRRNWDGYVVNGTARRITVTEAKRMMGFPDDYVFPVSDTQAMKQLGNSVAVDAVQEVAKVIVQVLLAHRARPTPRARESERQ